MAATKKAKAGEGSVREMVVRNENGMHARPAAMFVRVANRFKSDIFVEKDGERVNGKSIMGLLMLSASCGSKLTVEATGKDAETALEELDRLIEAQFDEK